MGWGRFANNGQDGFGEQTILVYWDQCAVNM